VKSLLEPVYRAVESGDFGGLQESMCDDVFMFTPEAGGVLASREAVVAYARRRLGPLRSSGTALALNVGSSKSGTDPSGRGAWVFDQVDVNIARRGVDMQAKVRVTALLKRELDRWRLAACYWSLPFATQAEQDAVKHAGQLEPGLPLEELITDEAQPLAAALTTALQEPRLLPELYSTREDHVTIGSVTDEIFVGPTGRAAWAEFVGYVSDYTLRGSLRAALTTNDLGWLAANIDIGQPPTPYRFFYIWLHETDTWRIVISHDAVSRSLTSDLGG
jgi:ketosteroid isomerase-like protein